MRPFLPVVWFFLAAMLPGQSVRVESGSGSGQFEAGSTVYVWADPPAPDSVFDRWTGDIDLLEEPFGIHTQFRMPSRSVYLRALYRPAALWNAATETLPGSSLQMVFHIPVRARGLILRFHGAGGSAARVFQAAESGAFNRDAVASGFGVLALDSSDRVNRQWNASVTPENPDIRNVQQAVNLLRQRGLLGTDTPLFASGASNGGGFVSRLAAFVPVRAASYYISSGISQIMDGTSTPAVWSLMVNDTALRADGNADAQRNFEALRRRGIPAQLYLQQPQPLHMLRFARIPGVSASDSRSIFTALQGAGFLDERGFLRSDPGSDAWRGAIPANLRTFQNEIADQLDICWAGHEFAGESNHRVIEFFTAALGLAAVANAASFVQSSVAADAIASFFAPQLNPREASANSAHWPLELAGAAASVRDSSGKVRLAPLAFVGPQQANLLIPAGTPAGPSILTVGQSSAFFSVAPLSPGLFTLEGTGVGTPAALLLRIAGNERVQSVVDGPIDPGAPGDQLYLSLFGTGWRNAPPLSIRIGDVELRPSFAGPQGTVPGLDQVNVLLPNTLSGRGALPLTVTTGGLSSNTAQLTFR